MVSSSALERVRDALEAHGEHQQAPGSWTCPAHDDRAASLSVTEGQDGRALLHCHAGCSAEDVVAALGLSMRDLFDTQPTPATDGCTLDAYAAAKGLEPALLTSLGVREISLFGKPAVRIPYRDTDGNETAVRLRTALSKNGNGDERFRWRKGSKPHLYGLDRLDAALRSGYVLLVEGESDCHTLWQHNLPAIGVPGSNAWRENRDATHLADIDRIYVVIEPDAGGETVREWVGRSSIRDRARLVRLDGADDISALHIREPDHDRFIQRIAEATAAADTTDPWKPGGDLRDTRELLDELEATIRRYVILPSEDAVLAVALWVMHSWAFDAAHATPYLVVQSPVKRSGKSRLLEVLELVARRPWRVAGASESAVFRKITADRPTLLLDEADAIFGANTERTEPLRALLNAGNRPGASVARCVGEGANLQAVDFDVYCPKVLAGIDTGRWPDTVLDRAIMLRLHRKAPGERVERLRWRDADAAVAPLRDQLDRWQHEHTGALREARPDLPDRLDDRQADGWEPLLAIADVAGIGERARAVAVRLASQDAAQDDATPVVLLRALRGMFASEDVLATADILEKLNDDHDLPFGAFRKGKGMDARGLARTLRPFEVKPRNVRVGNSISKGYRRDQFADAFRRYLPPPEDPHGEGGDPPNGVLSATSATSALQSQKTPDSIRYNAADANPIRYAILGSTEPKSGDVADVADRDPREGDPPLPDAVSTPPPAMRDPLCRHESHRPSDWALPGATVWICGACHPPSGPTRERGVRWRHPRHDDNPNHGQQLTVDDVLADIAHEP